MKVKTSELIGAALDWAVAKARQPVYSDEALLVPVLQGNFNPSTNWFHSEPIIEMENIECRWLPSPDKAHQYAARKPSFDGLNRTFYIMDGPTVLVATMRCYVASKLGETVDVPDELI